jgi:hypothetical protein
MKNKYDTFIEIIGKHLDFRDKNINFNEGWLTKMFEEIQQNIPNSTIDEISKLDHYCMGHIDYHHKFALYLDELYQSKTQ